MTTAFEDLRALARSFSAGGHSPAQSIEPPQGIKRYDFDEQDRAAAGPAPIESSLREIGADPLRRDFFNTIHLGADIGSALERPIFGSVATGSDIADICRRDALNIAQRVIPLFRAMVPWHSSYWRGASDPHSPRALPLTGGSEPAATPAAGSSIS